MPRPINTQKKWPCDTPFGRGTFTRAGRWAEYSIPYLPKLWTESCISSSQDYENPTQLLNLADSRADHPTNGVSSPLERTKLAPKLVLRPVHNEHRSPWPGPALSQRPAGPWAFCYGLQPQPEDSNHLAPVFRLALAAQTSGAIN